jgi:hypothetical protein
MKIHIKAVGKEYKDFFAKMEFLRRNPIKERKIFEALNYVEVKLINI